MHVYLSSGQQPVPRTHPRLELFIASLLPVTAILIVGVVGTRQMLHTDESFFVLAFLLCSLAVFLGEFLLLRSMQQASNSQLAALTAVCRDCLAGNAERRASVAGSSELVGLAQALNDVLDALTGASRQTPHSAQETALTDKQIKKLIHEINPILSGDLRARAQASSSEVGVVADLCNRLIEEVTHHIKEIRYVSKRIIRTSQHLLEYSFQRTQAAEAQRARFMQTTQGIETLVAFIQRMSSTLEVSADLAQQTLTLLQEKRALSSDEARPDPSHPADQSEDQSSDQPADTAEPADELLEKLHAQARQQVKVLDEVLQDLQRNVSLAESMIGDFYTVGQELQQSSAGIATIAKGFGSLDALAQRWLASIAPFRLLEEDSQALTTLEKETPEDTGWLT